MTRHLRLPSIVVALLVVTLAPTRAAKTIAFDALTIPEINQAFDTGALTSETLVQLCLARIDAYDRQGPSLHAVLTINPKARETARALDAERKTKGPRSPLHGIPVVLKDNYNTFDMPTTGGSVLLEGSVPPADAFIVKKLRAAGAIILAKVNMSEFASGGAHSSLGGQSLNPHDLTRSPRREGIAFRGEISACNCLGDRSRVIDVDRRDGSGETNAFEPAAYGCCTRSRRDRHGTRRRCTHAINREHVADSVDDRDRRIHAARLRFGDALRNHLLDVCDSQARGRAAARAAAATGLIGAGGRSDRIATGASGDEQHQCQQQGRLLHDSGASTATVGCGWYE